MDTQMKEIIEQQCKNVLDEVKRVIQFAELLEATNEQFYINWEIELSNLATKDHNK